MSISIADLYLKLTAEIEDLKGENKVLKAKNQAVTFKVYDLEEEMASKNLQIYDLEKAVDRFAATIEDGNDENLEVFNKLEAENEVLKEKADKYDSLMRISQGLYKAKEEGWRTATKLKAENEVLKEKFDNANAGIEELKKMIKGRYVEISDLKQQIYDLKQYSPWKPLESEIEDLKKMMAYKLNKIEDLVAEIEDLSDTETPKED